jgi:riboflavin biosynthesis pyrimidine reductase
LLAIVIARGDVPAEHPALHGGALLLATAAGARQLNSRLPPACVILDLDGQPDLPSAGMLAAVRARGGGTVLTEGGPQLLGQLVAHRLLNELFLTISPVLAGRGDTTRPGLVAARELLPCRAEPAELLSARRHRSYLFLRYAMPAAPPATEPSSG